MTANELEQQMSYLIHRFREERMYRFYEENPEPDFIYLGIQEQRLFREITAQHATFVTDCMSGLRQFMCVNVIFVNEPTHLAVSKKPTTS